MNSPQAGRRMWRNSGCDTGTRPQCPPAIASPGGKQLICCRKEPVS
jgi:hypothetical protein